MAAVHDHVRTSHGVGLIRGQEQHALGDGRVGLERLAQHDLVRGHLLGQVNVAEYFCDEGIRRIMLDVFSSRQLTQQTIDDGFL